MPVEPFVRFANERTIEPPLAVARLVARHQKHGAAHGVEREGNTPLPACHTLSDIGR